MLIKQNELINPLDEAAQLLETSQFLNESESSYQPFMVPIRESKQYDANLIRVEDLVEYALTNGITDANYAIDSVCEANDVDQTTVAFSIDESMAIYDEEMLDTARCLREAGYSVMVAPISNMNPVYQLVESVVDTMTYYTGTENEDYCDSLFEAFISDDYETVFSEASILDKAKAGANGIKNSVVSGAKNAKKFASDKLAALRKKYRELKAKAASATGSAKKKFLAAAAKVKQGIDHLVAKGKSAVNTVTSKFKK